MIHTSKYDADYWLENRAAIITALEKAGFQLFSNAEGFWIAPAPALPVAWQETTADGEPLWDYDNFLSTPEHFDYSRPLYAKPVQATSAQWRWQPIETAPKDAEVLFWIRPKTAEETYHNSYGEPLLMSGEGGARICKFRCWGILEIATHWMPLPAAPELKGKL